MLRTFIAISLPAKIQNGLGNAIETLNSESIRGSVRWVRPQNIHLTLKFLGDIPQTVVKLLERSLNDRLIGYRSFQLLVDGLGVFPGYAHPRVIWIGISRSSELIALQQDVEMAAYELGHAREDRPFSAHLTLGRVQANLTMDQMSCLQQKLRSTRIGDLGKFNVESIDIFQSQLSPGGSIYTKLASIKLNIV